MGSQEVDKAHDLCSSHGARLPLPENDQELDNLKFAIFKIDAKEIPLGAKKNEEGIWVDYSGNEIDSYLLDQYRSGYGDHLSFWARGSSVGMTTSDGSDTKNVLCEKATTGSATTTSLSEDSEADDGQSVAGAPPLMVG